VKNLIRHLDEQDVASIAKVLMKLAKNDLKARQDPKLRDVLSGVSHLLSNKTDPPFCPKDIADLAFALGKLQITDQCCMNLLKQIAETAKLRVENFTPHDMSNIVWGFASLGVRNESLMSVIAAEVVNKITGFDQRQLANTAWAFAKCGLWNEQLVNSIANECFEKIGSFTAQSLSHISWAMAQWGTRKEDLMDSIALETQRKITDFAPSSLAMTAWSFASLQLKCIPLMQAISHEAVGKITHFKTQDLAHLAWAFANVRIQDTELFNAMAAEIQKNIKGTLPPELSNIAWAFSKNNYAHEALMESIAQEAVLQIRQFKAAEIAMLTWAFAVAALQNKHLMTEIGQQVAKRIEKFTAPQLSHIAWAFGALSLRHSDFLSALSQHLCGDVSAFKGQSLANIAWAFAMVGYHNMQLLVLIAPSIANDVGDLRPLALARCAWAYRTLQVPAPDLMRALAKEALRKVNDFSTKALLKFVDSVCLCASVEETSRLEECVAMRIREISEFFIKAHGTPDRPARPPIQEYSDALRDKGIADAGVFGTPLLLSELGIEMPGIKWVQKSRRQPWLYDNPERAEGNLDSFPRRLNKGGPHNSGFNHYTAAEVDVCVVQEAFHKWFVRYSDEKAVKIQASKPEKPRLVNKRLPRADTVPKDNSSDDAREAASIGSKDQMPNPHGASADPEIGLYIPTDAGGKITSGDLTGLVLAEIYDEFCRRGCSPANVESRSAVTGSVRMVASSVPCLAVIGGLRQFLVTFPNITLEFYEQAGLVED